MNMELRKVLKYCKEHVPFYQKRFEKIDLENTNIEELLDFIPRLTKQDVAQNENALISDLYNKEKLKCECTSGSTGKPLMLYKTISDKLISGKSNWKVRSSYGVKPTDPVVRFHMIATNDDGSVDDKKILYLSNGISFSLLHQSESDIKDYYEALKTIQNAWIFAVPSAVLNLVHYIDKYKFEPLKNIQYIELSGEYCSLDNIEDIRNIIKCPVVNMYGLKEVYGVSYSCQYGINHVFADNVYAEVVDENDNKIEDEEGMLLITSLNNTAMPFVRYETGDVCKAKYDYICQCGRRGTVLELTGGRTADYITFSEDKVMSSCVFYITVSELNKIFHGKPIIQFQVLRVDDLSFYVNLVKKDVSLDIEKYKKEFISYVNRYGVPENMNWEFNFIDVIPLQKNGKYRYYIDIRE